MELHVGIAMLMLQLSPHRRRIAFQMCEAESEDLQEFDHQVELGKVCFGVCTVRAFSKLVPLSFCFLYCHCLRFLLLSTRVSGRCACEAVSLQLIVLPFVFSR